MQNDPELSGKYLGTISEDFIKVADTLREASYRVRKGGFAFPIFPISKEKIPIGQVLIERHEASLAWSYYVSFLDEFTQRGLIDKEREESFRESYKDPDEFCCLFVVDEEFTKFVFIPYPED
jgi:hypothetical protein